MSARRTLRQIKTIVAKDLLREWRTKEVTISTLAFSVVLLIIFTFGFYVPDDPLLYQKFAEFLALQDIQRSIDPKAVVFPGVLWISIIFSATIAIGRTFAQEQEEGCLRALALVPGAGHSIFIAKFILNLLYIAAFEVVLVPLIALLFDVPILSHAGAYFAVIAAGTIGYAALATLVSAMMVNSRLRDVMIPILLYPLIIPLMIGCLVVTKNIFLGDPHFNLFSYLKVLFAVDVVFLALSISLFKWVLEAIE